MDPEQQPNVSNQSKAGWRWPWWLLLIVVVLAIGAMLYLRNTNNEPRSEEPVGIVTISEQGFSPKTIQIKKGQAITWSNQDVGSHQLKSDELPAMDSGESIQKGSSYTYTFEKSGTYKYYDPSNPNTFKGTVMVEE